jgi:hypothetical protein
VDLTRRWVGPLCAVLGVLGFSFKAILVKLAYAWHPVDAVTLLALRMLYSAPFFMVMAWWAGRASGAAALTLRDWRTLAWLGFIGYYLASLLDFMGLEYISAALERLVLYCIQPGRAAHGLCCANPFRAGPRSRSASPTPASRSCSFTISNSPAIRGHC